MVSTIRLNVEYTFITNLFGQTNVDTILYISSQTYKKFDFLTNEMCIYYGSEGVYRYWLDQNEKKNLEQN